MLVFCVIVPQVSNPALALAIVAGMTFCHAGWGNIILPAEVFPKNAVGTVTGLGGALGSLIGALSQFYIGKVVDLYGFTPIFIACAGMYPLALLLVQLVIGKLGIVHTYLGNMRPVDVFFFFKGRVGRETLWCTWLSQILMSIIATMLATAGLFVLGIVQEGWFHFVVLGIVWLILAGCAGVLTWIGVAIQVKRWHDLGFSGWMVLLNLVPVFGQVMSFCALGFVKGTTGSNKYGSDPQKVGEVP